MAVCPPYGSSTSPDPNRSTGWERPATYDARPEKWTFTQPPGGVFAAVFSYVFIVDGYDRASQRGCFRSFRTHTLELLPLYWFHAFNRADVEQIVTVLRTGAKHHPDPNCASRVDERELGIDPPPHVYAYLGRTLHTFGKNVLALRMSGLTGTVSPFDSGGLLRKIEPVCSRTLPEKQQYLQDYSWSTSSLSKLLDQYPADKLAAYVAMKAPAGDGPHSLLSPKRSGAAQEPLWKANTDWRAWTWEGRSPKALPTGNALYRWTCPSNVYPEIVNYIATRPPAERRWFNDAQKLYVRGGLSNLMAALRREQETP